MFRQISIDIQDDTSEADMLEHPSQQLRTTRSGSVRGSPTSQNRGRIMRGSQRGGNRIQPIIWNQNPDLMGSEF